MGLLFSRFRKVPDSPSTKLECINKEIGEIETYKRQTQALQKKVVAYLLFYSIIIYLVIAILYFVYYFPTLTLANKFLCATPLLIFPALVYATKKFLHWYFVKSITDNDLKLADLKDQKNKIIEDVMENETYKKATEILEKFAPNRLHKLAESKESSPMSSPEGANSSRLAPGTPGTELRLRGNASLNASRLAQGTTPSSVRPMMPGQTPMSVQKPTMQQRSLYGAPPGPPLPRQVLPRDRSLIDKVFESFVGDGPQNRFALICSHCRSHNGMALPEEFEFLSFRCCYCFHMNAARKLRPNAPPLNLDTTVGSSDEDEAELETHTEPEDSDVEPADDVTSEPNGQVQSGTQAMLAEEPAS